jgi:hypothetical protein
MSLERDGVRDYWDEANCREALYLPAGGSAGFDPQLGDSSRY